MVSFKRNGEPGTNPIITALDNGKRELAFDNAFLYAAQQFGLEINLGKHKIESWWIGDWRKVSWKKQRQRFKQAQQKQMRWINSACQWLTVYPGQITVKYCLCRPEIELLACSDSHTATV